MYRKNFELLKNQLNMNYTKKTMKHNIRKDAMLLPFQTREPERAKFNRGFQGVLGEIVRTFCGKQLVEDKNQQNDGEGFKSLIQTICQRVEVCEKDKPYLEEIIKSYLLNQQNELKIIHPYLLLYVKCTEGKQQVGEKAIAKLVTDVLLQNNRSLKEYFTNKESNHVLMKLILKNMPVLDDIITDRKYRTVLTFIPELFVEDIEYLIQHGEFFVKNMELIFAYYYFFYVTQLSLKINRGIRADLTKPEPIYYLLDWESASRNRKSVEQGYSFIKEESRNLLIQVNVLDHLNTLFGTMGLTIGELLEEVDKLSEEKKIEYIKIVQSWISEYREFNQMSELELSNDFIMLSKYLEQSISDKLNDQTQGTSSRYSKNIEEIGKRYFLKIRGSYGYMLNLTQEMLLVITSICVKNKKMTITTLFQEYEKRGIYFDRYSAESINELLNKLNLIDKKSDSGEAQYVKSIL